MVTRPGSWVVRWRGWEPFFRGVYGSPATKADNLGRILAAEGVPPGQALFVGDGRRDLAAARQLGARFVGVRNAFNDFDPAGLTMIDDLCGLERAVAELERGGARD